MEKRKIEERAGYDDRDWREGRPGQEKMRGDERRGEESRGEERRG